MRIHKLLILSKVFCSQIWSTFTATSATTAVLTLALTTAVNALTPIPANAQVFPQQQQQQTKPLEHRNVGGFVRDSLNKPIVGATVALYSEKDTLKTSTNNFGFYGFQKVKSADFLLSIHALGYDPYNRRYYNNDTRAQLNIPAIRLGIKVEALDEITIQGLRGPRLKGDTTEFWARDYIVRDYARLEDLLRRMEGITIDSDGSVFYNGEPVVRALFNNETYFTGSVQEAMRELPADIVERIQIIDRDAEGLGEKSMQSDETTKVMNIVTKEDRSAGRMYQLSAEQGTQSRTKAVGSVRRIDGHDQLTFHAGHTQQPEGIKSDPVPGSISQSMSGIMIGGISSFGSGAVVLAPGGEMSGGSGVSDGRQKETTAGFGRNVLLGHVRLYPQYDFNYTDRWSGTHTLSEQFYDNGSILSLADSRSERQEQKHELRTNFSKHSMENQSSLNGNLSATYRLYNNLTASSSDRSGMINSLEERSNIREGEQMNLRLSGMYMKRVSPKWEIRSMLSASYNGDRGDEEDRTDIFGNGNTALLPDSTVHQLRESQNSGLTYGLWNTLSWNYSEQLKFRYSLTVNQNLNLRDIQARLYDGTSFVMDPDLSNYQRTHSFSVPMGLNVEYTMPNGLYFSPGIELVNSMVSGRLNPGTPSIRRFDAMWKTQLSMGYNGDKYGSGSVSYHLSQQQPGITQLNPDPYYITPYNVQQGNPDLENTRAHGLQARYNNYFPKLMLNIGLGASLSRTDNIISTDRIVEVDSVANIVKTMMHYRNVDGGKGHNIRFDLTRTFRKLNSTLKYDVSYTKSVTPYFMNGSLETRNAETQRHSLSFFFSPMNWFEVTPDLRYQASEDQNSLATYASATYNRVFYADLKLGFFLPKDFRINANITQSVHRSTNILTDTSPFVVNANIEKRIFAKKNGIISFVVMDMAQQNAFTNYHSNEQGYTNTLSNPDSRYFLLQFSWQPQTWGVSRHDAGRGRRGDGSYIR